MQSAKANLHGAISLVNAIASGKGATLGISLNVEVIIEISQGKGITIDSKNKNLSLRLIKKTIEKSVSKKDMQKTKIRVYLKSEIPTGYGLKSSSAISSAVALACAKLFKPKIDDSQVLLAGVNASIESGVSITGAYDDACACYYGGFMITDNYKRKIIHSKKAPKNLLTVIFIPRSRRRGNIKNLKSLSPVFEQAWNLAKNSDYWNAMILNGLAASSILNSDPKIITDLVEKGALGASVSGNGPAIAAVCKKENVSSVKKIFSDLSGSTIISPINNNKAKVYEL